MRLIVFVSMYVVFRVFRNDLTSLGFNWSRIWNAYAQNNRYDNAKETLKQHFTITFHIYTTKFERFQGKTKNKMFWNNIGYSILSWDWSPKSWGPKYSATQTNQLQNQYYTTHHIPHQSLNLFIALQYKLVGNLKPYRKLFSREIPSQLTSFQSFGA